MAGAVRYLIQRGDAFWARIVVPADLRPIVGKTELRAPLGSNRKLAARALHAAIAEMHDLLAAARGKLNVSALQPPRTRTQPLTVAQIAHTHFAEELAVDPVQMAVRDALIGFMAATAQAQAEATREAQKAGIAHAKERTDAYRGRKSSYTRQQLNAAVAMLDRSESVSAIAQTTGLSRQTIYRIKGDQAGAEAALARWAA